MNYLTLSKLVFVSKELHVQEKVNVILKFKFQVVLFMCKLTPGRQNIETAQLSSTIIKLK